MSDLFFGQPPAPTNLTSRLCRLRIHRRDVVGCTMFGQPIIRCRRCGQMWDCIG